VNQDCTMSTFLVHVHEKGVQEKAVCHATINIVNQKKKSESASDFWIASSFAKFGIIQTSINSRVNLRKISAALDADTSTPLVLY